jgi:PHD/YefM family antitoxin component YafN of YafNO toxin-antitoxin module
MDTSVDEQLVCGNVPTLLKNAGANMTITTLSSRQFNQDASKAKKAAMSGPVFITDRGRPAHVLLTFDEYKKITGMHTKIADLLAMPGIEDINLEIPQMRDVVKPADFT